MMFFVHDDVPERELFVYDDAPKNELFVHHNVRKYLPAENRLLPYFSRFLLTGGFPEIASERNDLLIRDYVISSVIRRVVYGDLFQEGGIGDPESLLALVRAISEHPGILMNYDRLGSDIGRDRRTVSSYISRLEHAMVIRTLGNITGNALSSSRKHRKAHPVSPALTFAFRGSNLDDDVMGRIYETVLVNHLDARYFWRRSGAEIDLITGGNGEHATEVKLGGEGPFHFGKYAGYRPVKTAVVVTRNTSGSGVSGDIEYRKVPAWAICAGAEV